MTHDTVLSVYEAYMRSLDSKSSHKGHGKPHQKGMGVFCVCYVVAADT